MREKTERYMRQGRGLPETLTALMDGVQVGGGGNVTTGVSAMDMDMDVMDALTTVVYVLHVLRVIAVVAIVDFFLSAFTALKIPEPSFRERRSIPRNLLPRTLYTQSQNPINSNESIN
jgi:hypothetical protein